MTERIAASAGWFLNGTLSGLIADGLFVLPGAIALITPSALCVGAGSIAFVTGLFAGSPPRFAERDSRQGAGPNAWGVWPSGRLCGLATT